MPNFQTIDIDLDLEQFGISIGGEVRAQIETTNSFGTELTPAYSDDEITDIFGELKYCVIDSGREGSIEVENLPEFISELVWEQVYEQVDFSILEPVW